MTNQLLDKIGAKNLRLAACLDPSDAENPSAAVAAILRAKVGLWLLAATRNDVSGQRWDNHLPIHNAAKTNSVAPWIALAPDTPLVLDAVYDGPDDEYLDAIKLEALSKGSG